ncbi:Metallo-dependent phosphatase-like protein [Mucidula mucida]|nr:Metallo-dependent phosphatase-like protein [Mucidula mucida]
MDDDESEHGTPGPSKILNDFPDDTIKILLATDNHIGYLERDPVRGQDSINTFREILQLARKHDVDFILLAGDLFHENKPSRNCLYSTIALLREYTMGDKPVQIELLSDPDEGKADGFTFPAINYEDPNFNVGIPVFSIHGNHDDPQGAGAEGALCALDVLSVTGLLNYMGKIDLPMSDADAPTTGIAVRPVLLRKGNTHLGMYGIGNVKDQRMHFELRSNRVRMFMPQNKDDWFNILLLHQNRVKHGPQESVPEGMFDDSINLVIWGHEHDCRIVPEPVAGKNYYICQPGSSVATSLADGEAIEKHVALVKVQGKDFQLTPLPLRTVRPFVIEEVSVSELASEYNFELNDQISINKYLKIKVNKLIDTANAQSADRNALAVSQGEEDMPPMLPLIRLKVDTTGVSDMSNPIRFGQEFQGRVANPRDLLVFTRSKRAARTGKVSVDQPELSIDDPDLTSSEKLAKVRVATLVKEFLAAQEPQLLGENGMSDAIQMFVEKDDIHAIQTHVGKTLKSMMKGVKANGGEPGELDEEDLDEVLTKAKEQQEKEYLENAAQNKPSKGKGKAKADESDAPSEDSMMMDIDVGGGDGGSDFDSDEPAPPPKKKAPAKKAPAKAAPAKKAPAKKAPAKGRAKKKIDTDSDAEVIDIPDDDEIEDDDEDEPAPPPKKRTGRAAVLSQSQAPAKKAPARKKAPAASAAKQSQLSFTPAGRSSTRAAATKAKGKMVIDSDSD